MPRATNERAPLPGDRILMVPGPSNLHPRTIQALIAPVASHKDPEFMAIMVDMADLLRGVFQTKNRATFALPATGGSGMEASLVNLLEPGDTVVVGRGGFFANRMINIAERASAKVVVVDAPWGQAIDPEQLIDAARRNNARVIATVHGETSTGVEHPLEGVGAAMRSMGGFLVVDAVASLGGTPLPIDDLQIDICYSGSQKCLSAPPGLSPISVSDRALEHIQNRKTQVQSWYLDLSLHARYWDSEHIYHHTGPVLSVYALREALRIIEEEGLEEGFARHKKHHRALLAGLDALGLRLFADPNHRLTTVTTVLAPDGIDSNDVRKEMMATYKVEVAAGLEEFADRMWRIGLMGNSATQRNVMIVLEALEQSLRKRGHHAGSATEAAAAAYEGAAAR